MRVETTGPLDAKIMIVGDAPGDVDDRLGKPFVGRDGQTLNNLLSQANIERYKCLLTYVAKERPPAGKISYFFEDKKCLIPKEKMQIWIDELKSDILLYKPNIVIALGPTALWALYNEKKIAIYRGYVLESTLVPGVKIIPIYHPKAINFDWKLYFQTVLDFRKAKRQSEYPELSNTNQIFLPNVEFSRFISYMNECISHPEWDKLAIDVETVQPGSHIEELGLSHSPDFGISIFLLKGRSPALPENDELLLWQTFAKLVSQKKIIMQNAAYDTGILWYNQHILIENLWMDTLIAAHVCWPELPRDLGFLGSVCLDVPPWKSGSAKTSVYNPADAANTFGIAEVLDLELDSQQVRHTFDFEMGLIPVALMMQLQGIAVDTDKKAELLEKWKSKKAEMQEQLDTLIGRKVNFNSPKQMQELLYGELQLPPQFKRRKSKNDKRTLTTDAAALRTLARNVPDNPIFNLILMYKKADTLLRFLDVELSPENKVHTCYNITGASSDDEEDTKKTKRSFGRWSSSKSIILPFGSGNLQNIPPEARKMYTAKPGWKIIEADYKQAEAVIVSHLTHNFKMIKMFEDAFGLPASKCKPYDIHILKATELYGVSANEVTKDQRTVGKTIRHARNYCVDDKTEVLTPQGWKPIYLINSNIDTIAQWDKNEEIKFVKPEKLYKYEYSGELMQFKNSYVSLCVTENHRVVVNNRKINRYKTIYSQNLFNNKNGDYQIPLSGFISNTSTITPEFIKLFTAVQADGSFRERDRHGKEISFTIKKERKIDRLKELLDDCDIVYTTYNASEDRIGFYINGSNAKELFDFIKYTNKKFGSWILSLDKETLLALVEESKWWDSRRNKSGESWQYYSKHRSNCEWLQVAAHLVGKRATVYDGHPTVYTTNITNTMYTAADKLKREVVDYEGYVYSLKVPSSYYLIRREGLISVTGNSAGPNVLANRLGITLTAARKLIELDQKMDPTLDLWHSSIQQHLQKNRVLTNLLGRKHRFLDRWGDALFRSAYSYIPQSTVGDLLNVSLRKLYDTLPTTPFEITILLQLHDAIYVMIRDENVNQTIKILRDSMIRPLEYNNKEFLIDVDFKLKTSWAEGEEVEIDWREVGDAVPNVL